MGENSFGTKPAKEPAEAERRYDNLIRCAQKSLGEGVVTGDIAKLNEAQEFFNNAIMCAKDISREKIGDTAKQKFSSLLASSCAISAKDPIRAMKFMDEALDMADGFMLGNSAFKLAIDIMYNLALSSAADLKGKGLVEKELDVLNLVMSHLNHDFSQYFTEEQRNKLLELMYDAKKRSFGLA